MTLRKKVIRFMINRHDGAAQYDYQIDKALSEKKNNFSYIVQDIEDYKSLPRFLALIIFWLRAQYTLFFRRIDVAILSPSIMLIYPRYVSIICIAHHYDPDVFKGMRKIYVKLSHWLFVFQRSSVAVVVSCSKYWSRYYKAEGFRNTITIYNGFDIKSMDHSVYVTDNSSVLQRFNLISKKYLHLGSYGTAKGQKMAVKCLKGYELPLIATSSSKALVKDDLQDIHLINASFNEYNVLLKNAKAVICMSEFKEGWCRVLHEAAIHGTPILGSGLGGMKELLEIGGFTLSTADKLSDDLDIRCKDGSMKNDKMNLYRAFTLERFCKAWCFCIENLLNE